MIQCWTVWCDNEPDDRGRKCLAMDQVSGTKARAANKFKLSGWKRIRGSKWLCPDCAKEAAK